MTDMEGSTFGVGARFGFVLSQSRSVTIAFEAVAEYLFPPCDVVDCDVIALQGNFLFRRQVASYAEAYGGAGIAFQAFSLEDGDLSYEGNDLGVNLVVGTQAGQPGKIRPFLEVRFTFMDELETQAGVSLGLRIPVG